MARHFAAGLDELLSPRFLQGRYQKFQSEHDPIYHTILASMQDESLVKAFVSYWTIAQTMATQSRFWLEDAIAEIVVYQCKHMGRRASHVYWQKTLGLGHIGTQKSVAEIGEEELEHRQGRKPWRVLIQDSAVNAAAFLVEDQERARLSAIPTTPHGQERFRDESHFQTLASALTGPPTTESALHCNLLVVEPDKLDARVHAHAIRFVNRKTMFSHAVRKQERINLLRLYAFLVQEKILRDPVSIHVCVAELVDRQDQNTRAEGIALFERGDTDHFPMAHQAFADYFSETTYWSADRLWKFIGVPYEYAVLSGIHVAAKGLGDKLRDALRTLLPDASHVRPERQGQMFPKAPDRTASDTAE